jgi:hypothetical protein
MGGIGPNGSSSPGHRIGRIAGSPRRRRIVEGALGVALWLTPLPGLAGPNAGGTLVAHDPNLTYTVEVSTYRGLGESPVSCQMIDFRLDGSRADQPKVWKVYALFARGASPRLKAMTFGIHYNPDDLAVSAYGACIGDRSNGALEIPQDGWPGSDTGTSIVFQEVQTGHVVECYWFAGYDYSGKPTRFQIRDNPDPDMGGNFADDSIPSEQDVIAAYGSLGFDTAGRCPCPAESVEGGGKDSRRAQSAPRSTR